MAVLADAVAHGAVELGPRPVADAVFLVGRDIGREDRPERRLERQPAGPGRAALDDMAGIAIGRDGDIGAALGQRLHLLGRERLLDLLGDHAALEQAEEDRPRRKRTDDSNRQSGQKQLPRHQPYAFTKPGVLRARSRTASK